MAKKKIDVLDDIPESIQTPIDLKEPNERITIYEGDFVIKHKKGEIAVRGEIFYSWFPSNAAKFICETEGVMGNFDGFNHFEIWINNYLFSAKAVADKTSLGANFVLSGKCGDCAVMGDRTLAVSEIAFVIPNLRLLEEGHIKDERNFFLGRTRLEYGKFIIILDAFPKISQRDDKLNAHGGFYFTYRGVIRKKKGNVSLKEVETFSYGLANFIFFLNGRRTMPMFLTGRHNNEHMWVQYEPAKVDPYKHVVSWAQAQRLEGLNKIWNRFNELWSDENDRDFLETAIHWYVEANTNAGYVEGSIIFAQTALELLFNWLILEKKKIIKGQDAESLSAANKIRLLISLLNISPEIPLAYKNLKKYSKDEDGPGAFVFIRNCLVHGQRAKRIELKKMEVMAKFEAAQLAIWYIELALLYILEFDQPYHNRTSGKIWASTGDKLPWSPVVTTSL